MVSLAGDIRGDITHHDGGDIFVMRDDGNLLDNGGDLLGDGGDLLGDGVDLLGDGVDLLLAEFGSKCYCVIESSMKRSSSISDTHLFLAPKELL